MALQNPSIIDDFFKNLTGMETSKDGRSFEIISTAVLALLRDEEAKHDVMLKGSDATKYQIDGLLDGKEMVEAKDYTVKNKKVGRVDLQKQQGALTSLPEIEHGYIASATEFTKDAEKYAKGTETNKKQTEINTVEIRPSTLDDKKGRIEQIMVEFDVTDYDYEYGKYNFLFKEGERQRLNDDAIKTGATHLALQVDTFYDGDGMAIATMKEVTKEQMIGVEEKGGAIAGRINIEAFIKWGQGYYAISGIDYSVPVVHYKENFVITKDGEPVIYVKCEAKGINKLITDKELKAKIDEIIGGKEI